VIYLASCSTRSHGWCALPVAPSPSCGESSTTKTRFYNGTLLCCGSLTECNRYQLQAVFYLVESPHVAQEQQQLTGVRSGCKVLLPGAPRAACRCAPLQLCQLVALPVPPLLHSSCGHMPASEPHPTIHAQPQPKPQSCPRSSAALCWAVCCINGLQGRLLHHNHISIQHIIHLYRSTAAAACSQLTTWAQIHSPVTSTACTSITSSHHASAAAQLM
jgi:hypothetical protein